MQEAGGGGDKMADGWGGGRMAAGADTQMRLGQQRGSHRVEVGAGRCDDRVSLVVVASDRS